MSVPLSTSNRVLYGVRAQHINWPRMTVKMFSARSRFARIMMGHSNHELTLIGNFLFRRFDRVRLSPSDLRYFTMIATRPARCSTDDIYWSVWGDDKTGGPDNPVNAISVHITILNKKLSQLGVRAINERGFGFSLHDMRGVNVTKAVNNLSSLNGYCGSLLDEQRVSV